MPVQFKDYYKTLGVAKSATAKEIKAAYRKLARQWHPDVNPTRKKQAEDRFKEISEAYEVLGDAEKRKMYDSLGPDWEQRARQPGGRHPSGSPNGPGAGGVHFDFQDLGDTGFSDFFQTFFSGLGRSATGGGRRTRSMRGTDAEYEFPLTLTEAYSGGSRSFSLQTEAMCPRCHGTGTENGKLCHQCRGAGTIPAQKTVEVTIPAGVRDGQRIRLSGLGGPGAGGAPNGDLYLIAKISTDATFERRGDDLHVEQPVSVYTLVLGGEVTVPTMTGRIDVKIPATSQNGRILRIGGKGMPKRGGGHGDLYVRLVAQVPTILSDRERELFGELATLAKAR